MAQQKHQRSSVSAMTMTMKMAMVTVMAGCSHPASSTSSSSTKLYRSADTLVVVSSSSPKVGVVAG